MTASRSVGFGVVVILTCVGAACSSVPDAVFGDDAGPPRRDAESEGAPDAAPSCTGAPGAVCCGPVTCVGCASPGSGECRECADACKPSELCCKRGGPPRCVAFGTTCD